MCVCARLFIDSILRFFFLVAAVVVVVVVVAVIRIETEPTHPDISFLIKSINSSQVDSYQSKSIDRKAKFGLEYFHALRWIHFGPLAQIVSIGIDRW